MLEYDRRSAAENDGIEEPSIEEKNDFGELQVAEYVVFLLSLDTYLRYLQETSGGGDIDSLGHDGITLLRLADSLHIDAVGAFISKSLKSNAQKNMLERALRLHPSAANATRRAFMVRTVLVRGGNTMRAVFKGRALIEVKEAVAASAVGDPDAALDLFAAIPIKNVRIRKWIDKAAKLAGAGMPPNMVAAASAETTEDAHSILKARITKQAAPPASEEHGFANQHQESLIAKVQNQAEASSRRALDVSGQQDKPPTRSEVIGIATAAVVSAATDPQNINNLPPAFRGPPPLDEEQQDAAITDGRVIVQAGAGAGKTATLVARIAYLVQEKKVSPSRIFVVTFNKKAGGEIKERLAKKIGDEAVKEMSAGTMHSIFRRFIIDYGNREEKEAVTTWMMASGDKKFPSRGPSPAALGGYMGRVWKECKGKEPPPKSATVIQQWQMNNVSPEQAAKTSDPLTLEQAEWYKWWLGFKGVDKNWKPPCGDNFKANKAWGEFLAKYRDNGNARIGDFSDMIIMFRDILKRDPSVRKKIQGLFDHVLVDEAQDLNEVQHEVVDMITEHVTDGKDGKSVWLVGDELQCVHEDTLVAIGNDKTARAGDIKAGDSVLSYRNGEVVSQSVVMANKSNWTWGYKITTETGKTLSMSPNHRIWADTGSLEDGLSLVYLMYRKDKGFRVGVTTSGRNQDEQLKLAYRARFESADAMWILEALPTEAEALLAEETYSLTYGVPTCVFNGRQRNLDQDRLDEIFRRFGANGIKLLEAKNLDPELPHWRSYGATRASIQRRVIQMTAHNQKGTIVTLEWTGTDLHASVSPLATIQEAKFENRFRVRKYSNSYREALAFAHKLQQATGIPFNRRMAVPEETPYQLINASGLFKGMRVIVQDEDTITTEEIVQVEKQDGKFVDLDVNDASNFFGGGILSHNSINRFVGARPELFAQFVDKPGWKVRKIKTNYRSLPEIVENANKLMSGHPKLIPMESRPDPTKPRGQASIVLQTPPDHATGAIQTIDQIAQDLEAGEPITDYAILSRTKMELNDFETACIIKGVPYGRRGGTSFLRSPETITVMSYFNLAVGQDFERMQRSLAEVFNKPNRFFLRAGESERIIQEAIQEKARKTGVSEKQVNPLDLFDDAGIRILVDAMDPGRKWENWKVSATRKELESMGRSLEGMRKLVDDGKVTDRDGKTKNYTTQDLIGDILNLQGVPESKGKDPPRLRDVLLPSAVGGQEEEEDDPNAEEGEKPVGNVQFLFQIAQGGDGSDGPSNPKKFKSRIDELVKDSKELRVDIDAWDKAQQGIPNPDDRKAPPCVVLSTVHSVKGAQWNKTTVVMAKGTFPMEKKAKPGQERLDPEMQARKDEADSQDFLTERQLAYVAMTRAKKDLTIICPSVNAYGKAAGKSIFVMEAGLQNGQNVAGKNDPTPDTPPSGTARTVLAMMELPTPDEALEDTNVLASEQGYDRRPS